MPPIITRGQWTQSVATAGIRSLAQSVWKSDGSNVPGNKTQGGELIPAGQDLGSFISGRGASLDQGAFTTWVTSAWDVGRGQMMLSCGSGDQGWTSNEVNVFDLATGVWTRPMDPTVRLFVKGNQQWQAGTVIGLNDPGNASPYALIDTTGLYHAHAVPVGGQYLYPNGRQHYGGMMHMPSVNKYLLWGGVGWWAINGAAHMPFEWDPVAATWEGQSQDLPGSTLGSAFYSVAEPLMAWDGVQGRVLCFCGSLGDALIAYYPTRARGLRWVVLQAHLTDALPGAGYGPSSVNYAQLVYDPKRQWAWMFGGQLGMQQAAIRWDLTGGGAPVSTARVGVVGDVGWLPTAFGNGPGVAVDPVEDKYLAWVGGSTLYKLTPSAGATITSQAITPGGVVPTTPQFTWNRLAYLPTYDVFATINHASDLGAFVYAPVRIPAPALACTDLASGPRTGNADTAFGQVAGQDGAYVTIYGYNFGNPEDTVTVTINGAAARLIDRGQATGARSPATLYNQYMKLQLIVAQVSHLATVGAGVIDVVVNGQTSTASDLPFTVTATGHIYYAPDNFTSVQNLLNGMVGGDVGYVRSGVNAPSGLVMQGNTGQQSNGQQIALGAAPGAAVQIGDNSHDAVVEGATGSGYLLTLFKCNLFGNSVVPFQAVTLHDNGRAVGNKFQCPGGQGKAGTLGISGSTLAVLANEFTNCGAVPTDDQYHVVYRSGRRFSEGGLERGFRGAYNYFHGNNAARAFNIFNDSDPSGGLGSNAIADHEVDHNVIVDQQYAGIGFQAGVVGTNSAHDNLLIRCGLSRELPGFASAVQLNAGYPQGWAGATAPITLTFERNTFLNCGEPGAATSSVFYIASAGRYALAIRNNLVDQLNGQPYVKYALTSDVLGPDASLRSHNLWFGAGAPPALDTAPLTVDPLVVSAVTPLDLHLQSTSQCIGHGTSLSSLVYDLDGLARPVGTPCDIGAYQFGPSAPSAGPSAPVLTSLVPLSCLTGAASFTLTVVASAGQGFVTGAQVFWDGAPRTTTFVNAQQVTIPVPAADVVLIGPHSVTATNPGSAISNSLTFNVQAPPATLTLVYNGKLRDCVSPVLTAGFVSDGFMDGTLTATVGAMLSRSITQLSLTAPVIYQGNPITATWLTVLDGTHYPLGVALTPAGALINNLTTRAVNFAPADGSSFTVFGSDDLSTVNFDEFTPGIVFTLTATLSDGSSAAGSVTIAGPSAPTLTSLNPSVGPAGITVQLLGANFSTTPGGNVVRFGTTPATIISEGASAIFCSVPLQPDAVYDVTVTTSAGTSNALPFNAVTLAAAGYGHPAVRTRFRRWS